MLPLYSKLYFFILFGGKKCFFATKNCWKSSYIYVFILSKKQHSLFQKKLHNSGMVGRRKLPDPSLNRIFNVLSIGVQYTLLFQWTNFSLKCLPIDHISKVRQKSCCNDICQVAVLKELVDGTLERDFTKASNASVLSLFFLRKVHESVFKHLVLNCTINRDVCKRTCLIGVFMQHLTHFWLGF